MPDDDKPRRNAPRPARRPGPAPRRTAGTNIGGGETGGGKTGGGKTGGGKSAGRKAGSPRASGRSGGSPRAGAPRSQTTGKGVSARGAGGSGSRGAAAPRGGSGSGSAPRASSGSASRGGNRASGGRGGGAGGGGARGTSGSRGGGGSASRGTNSRSAGAAGARAVAVRAAGARAVGARQGVPARARASVRTDLRTKTRDVVPASARRPGGRAATDAERATHQRAAATATRAATVVTGLRPAAVVLPCEPSGSVALARSRRRASGAPPPVRSSAGADRPARPTSTPRSGAWRGRNGDRFVRLLMEAADAFAHDREREALRILRPLRDQLPDSPSVRELVGLCQYRIGNYAAATKELEAYAELSGSVDQNPVLMDCYRAQRRWRKVDEAWLALAEASPNAELGRRGAHRLRRRARRPGQARPGPRAAPQAGRERPQPQGAPPAPLVRARRPRGPCGQPRRRTRSLRPGAPRRPGYADVAERLAALG